MDLFRPTVSVLMTIILLLSINYMKQQRDLDRNYATLKDITLSLESSKLALESYREQMRKEIVRREQENLALGDSDKQCQEDLEKVEAKHSEEIEVVRTK